ncbi:MAG TPA: TonB-dependent receptor [Tenuifilaceae bacterium]|nr:TonB-dependent receptor [Tenuifilaceae bacterium]HPE18684.1 TonB-dependent receptor [Tenuifilaceae bacterium]HPJ45543.1 TonB-dependent receptor [Tenuifilaceae bacterium]HPQ33803.1 TonB-dependent receptor [Tenuifilaceae bacterium]HRX68615.1 TonB-dependent receptor [Tenuifilaceae bacterium]
MLKHIFTTILLLNVVASIFAIDPGNASSTTPGNVKGFVYDSLSRQPLEYATVSIYRTSDNSLVTGTITDANGFFRVANMEPGNYALEISFIGYNNKRIANFEIAPNKRNFDLGQIILQSADNSLEEVMVVADRPTMKYQIDKKVINVSQLHTSSSGTAVEILENIPSVTVSIEGDVSLRGSGSFTVLIDGKPSIMDANDVLNQIPASQIENIEIITNPSAKFDPDGVAGIINIIMKKNRLQGVSGVVNTNVGTHGRYGGDFLVNFRKDRVNFNIGADFNKRSMIGNSIYESETYQADTTYLYNTGEFDRSGNSWGLKAGIDFNINPKNTFSIGYRLGDRNRGGSSTLDYEEWNSSDLINKTIYASEEESNRGGIHHNLNFDYRKEFNTKEHNLLMQFVWETSESEDKSLNLLYDNLNTIVQGQRSVESGPEKEYTLKLDYTLPFGKESKFEAGYQGNMEISNEFNGMYLYNIANQTFEFNDQFSKDVDYSTTIHAMYSLISGKLGGLGYQFGLRTEHTNRVIDLVGEPDEFTLNRWDYYPTVHFSYNLPADQEIMTSYTRRLQRLRGWYLEPFYTWHDAYNIRIGNPDLVPEYIDSYELSYQKKFSKNVISVDMYYRVTHNKIESIRSIYDDNANVFLTTFFNVGKDYSLGTEVMVGFDPTKWWHFDLMGNIYDYKQEGTFDGRDYSTSSFNWNARLNNSFKLAKFTRLQLTGMYNSPTVTAQGEQKGFMVTNLALKQDFFKNALSLTLQVRDIFGTMGHERTVRDIDFYTYSKWDPNTPIVSLTATIRLNNYRPDRKRSQQQSNGDMEDISGGEGEF